MTNSFRLHSLTRITFTYIGPQKVAQVLGLFYIWHPCSKYLLGGCEYELCKRCESTKKGMNFSSTVIKMCLLTEHYRFLHGQAQQNWLPGLLKQFNRSLWVHSESWVSKSGYWGHLRKLRFCVFLAIFTKPHQFCLRSRVFSPFWHSAIVVNIIGDEYGSILIFTVFGFGLFLAVFGHFWAFLAFFGFGWRCGGFGSASEL